MASQGRRGSPTVADEGRRASRLARFTRDHWMVLVILVIMVAAFLVRLLYLMKHTQYTTDSYYFMILARSIGDTFTYTVRDLTHIKYLPGYPIAIWLGEYVFGGLENSASAIALAGGALTVLTTYGIGKELFNRWVGLTAALILAFQPTFLKWTSLPMTEGMFTFLFSGGIYLIITGCRRASAPRRTLGALAGGLCFLTRWEGALFLPLMVLIVVIYIADSRLKSWEPPVMLLLFAVPMGIYLLRNLIVAGKVTPYYDEYKLYSPEFSLSLVKSRLKVYGWDGMSHALFSALFYVGAAWCLARKRWKAFLVIGGWFAMFVVFHLFWYYPYERFMAPAVPAVALMIAFLFVDLAAWAGKLFAGEGPAAAKMKNAITEQRRGALLASARLLTWTVLFGLLAVLITHGMIRADRVTSDHYKALSDDHGGRGMVEASDWLEKNAPGQMVAVDAGPYFNWLYYPGDILYLRPVPWDLPTEDKDVEYRNVPDQLYRRGARYMVVGQTEKGVEDAFSLFGITSQDRSRLMEVARWVNHYEYPEPHYLTTVIFEVLPPP